jgi:hypothetical protein
VDPDLSIQELVAENARLRAENARLAALVADLQEKLAAALAQIEQLKRGGKGGAAPFSKGKPKQNPRKPGRKPNQGLFTRRKAPDYENCDVTEEVAAVDAPLCPDCGGQLGIVDYEEASTVDIPEMPRPRVKRFRVEVRRCSCCTRVLRGRHPDLKPDQFGATAHRVSDTVYAYAHWLHYGKGIPVRRIPALLWQMMRIPLTQGAITQGALRSVGQTRDPKDNKPNRDPKPPGAVVRVDKPGTTGPIGQIYLALRLAVAQERVVHTDDTSWRIAGKAAWLMVFSSVDLVVYQIRDHHRNEEVREVLEHFAGKLVCDRGSSYESRNLVSRPQQKCLSHLIRNIKAVLAYLVGEDLVKAETLLELLREGLALWRAHRMGEVDGFECARRRIRERADELLIAEAHLNPYLHTLLNGIAIQHDRGNLLRFLEDPEIEPTNNRAERDLRGPVIARKISQCSRTEAGAEAHAAWSSVVATLDRLGVTDPVQALIHCQRMGKLPGIELPPARVAGLSATR